MWRLVLQAGKFFLSKEAVPKGATMLSEHASKKAGQAALKKVEAVQVKKIPKGDPKTAPKGDPVWEGRQWLSKEKFDAQQKARKAFLSKKPGYQEAVDRNIKESATSKRSPTEYKPFKKMEKSETVYRGKKPPAMDRGGTVPKEKPKSKYKKLPIRTEKPKPKPKPPIEKILKKPKSKYRLLNKGGTVSAKKKTAKKTWNY